ncbi:MAG: LytTR family transcriptional regulator [Bacteroidales bacterium]|nr:LytTR family transcriptional regulator [Bacteroidales bacterium]
MGKETSTNTLISNGNKIGLSDKNGFTFFEISKILRCQSDNSYTLFYMLNENGNKNDCTKVLVSKGFDYLEDFLLSKGAFFRVHNQHIININHIKRYIKNDGGYLIMDDKAETRIPVARARRLRFMEHLKKQGIIF